MTVCIFSLQHIDTVCIHTNSPYIVFLYDKIYFSLQHIDTTDTCRVLYVFRPVVYTRHYERDENVILSQFTPNVVHFLAVVQNPQSTVFLQVQWFFYSMLKLTLTV
jgi:hypothetical protein